MDGHAVHLHEDAFGREGGLGPLLFGRCKSAHADDGARDEEDKDEEHHDFACHLVVFRRSV